MQACCLCIFNFTNDVFFLFFFRLPFLFFRDVRNLARKFTRYDISFFFVKYGSDSSGGEGDFSREDKPEDGSESSKNDRDSSVNESGQESLTDHAISQSWKPIPTRMQTEILKPIVVQFKIQCFPVFFFLFFFTDVLMMNFILRPLSDCFVFSVRCV